MQPSPLSRLAATLATALSGLGVCAILLCLPGTLQGAPLPPAVGRMLVADASMSDPRFRHAVILLLRHGDGGTLGLVINRRARVTLASAFPGVPEMQGVERHLWLGGPVEPGRPAMLVEAAEPPPDAMPVEGALYFSRSEALMRSLATVANARFRIYAGYAGWAPGQLAAELAQGAWTVAPAGVEHVFTDDEENLWKSLQPSAAGTWVRHSPPSRR